MLGERIRKLRKQKKMTLEALAGKELTKGMLSLIENNKAKPSMESLAYIAEQLEVDVTELLEENSLQELREVLEKAEKLYNTPLDGYQEKYKDLFELIAPYAASLSQGYEAARLLELYGYALVREGKHGWESVLTEASVKYEQLNITSNRAAIGIYRAMKKFTEYNYKEALTIFLNERKEIESKHVVIDPLTRLNLDYHESVFFFAVGDSEAASLVMEEAILFSKEKRIFYNINDLYRLTAAQAVMSKDVTKTDFFSKKLQQYGEFADHQDSIMFHKLIEIVSLISHKQGYQHAFDEIEHLEPEIAANPLFKPWFYHEKGKALYYLGQLEEALDCLEQVVVPKDSYHPFDLSLFYIMDSYKALIHFELGNKYEALKYATTAVKNFEPILETSFKAFSREVYEKILSS